MKKHKYFLVLAAVMGMTTSCEKDDNTQNIDNNRIPQIIADNFNLSLFNVTATRSNLLESLYGKGPYTVLAPSDAAFQSAGYLDNKAILSADYQLIFKLAGYHVLQGRYELNKLPFLFNQEVQSMSGGKLFVTRWVKNGDTTVTVNGSRVLTNQVPASNGIIEVLDRVLEPYAHNTVVDGVAGETSLTLFSQALVRSGLDKELAGKGPFTVYAPNNTAMIAMGYPTVQAINAANPTTLANIVRYNIVADRRFINDYFLSASNTVGSTQGMIDGNSVKITFVPDPASPGAYKGITLLGTGNTSPVNVTRRDINTGNGVIHIVDQVLKITQ
ncbi:putative surface protein with fasciclin (FAS1) repeats [Chitinophaga skermanii]|uniref:Putative surface protein with fasciclin (FAS1) repeats n=1 Tax=Chitinophaga skermanii TaxID=331697 RepID=A0A327QXP1_9BACT|nr:fasciclin domain-containing protein [Chitinophaga skermanii]RAJ08735.1 putative surface protein with fasciclin (FAS1) repeats [Chitinophaga skermanii]